MTLKALFLDRDGVINQDSGYPHTKEQIVFIEEIFDVCRLAQNMGYLLIVVTNQAGIAKGLFTEKDVEDLHDWMKEEFALRGITIAKFYVCPYHKDSKIDHYKIDSPLRKPNPGMVLLAAEEYNLDLSASIMVGDKPSDRIRLPNLKSIIVKSKYSLNDYDIANISELVSFLC